MPTTNQLVRKGRNGKVKKPRKRFLAGQPVRSAIVVSTFARKPAKPNSGDRHVARVRFSDGTEVTAAIPGEGHNVQTHSKVLVQGGSRPDHRGVKYKIVRGNRDTAPVQNRKQGRSRYGTKKTSTK